MDIFNNMFSNDKKIILFIMVQKRETYRDPIYKIYENGNKLHIRATKTERL